MGRLSSGRRIWICCWIFAGCFWQLTLSGLAFSSPSRCRNKQRHCGITRRAQHGSSKHDGDDTSSFNFVILGGTGQIGSAVANHILLRQPNSKIILVGRNKAKATQAVEELRRNHPNSKHERISYSIIESVWNANCPALQKLINETDCLIHTAGPYSERKPVPLQLAILSPTCRAYVDVSDPLPYIEASLLLSGNSSSGNSKTLTALVAAGAFPGMSNVLGMEAVSALQQQQERNQKNLPANDLQTLRFHYFTAGLGGSGPINLYITNIGFGDYMTQFQNGEMRFYAALSGLLLGSVDFFLPRASLVSQQQQQSSAKDNKNDNNSLLLMEANEAVKRRVGTRQIFAWPFPEAATVPTVLRTTTSTSTSSNRLRGDSSAGMGTAPAMWTSMLGILVKIIPRSFWRNQQFSKFMADFSQPLVWMTDQWMRLQDRDALLGETHAMRIDATRRDGSGISIVQAHDSFRHCVGQSCAEFAMDCLAHPALDGGGNGRVVVTLPEQRYQDPVARQRIVRKLTCTPGTFCYTGPVPLDYIPPPTRLNDALNEADQAEQMN